MQVEDEQTFLQFVIGRYDHFFDSVHNKANFWLAFNIFSIGGVVTGYKDFALLLEAGPARTAFDTAIGLFIFVGLGSSALMVWASLPFLSKSPHNSSTIFFREVAARTQAEFVRDVGALTPDSCLADHRVQAHQLACGLTAKYAKLLWAGRLILTQFLLLAGVFGLFISGSKTSPAAPPPCPPLVAPPAAPARQPVLVLPAVPAATVAPTTR